MSAIIGNAIAALLVAGLVAVCAAEILKGHKSGSCGGGCAGCSGSCSSCGSCSREKPAGQSRGTEGRMTAKKENPAERTPFGKSGTRVAVNGKIFVVNGNTLEKRDV